MLPSTGWLPTATDVNVLDFRMPARIGNYGIGVDSPIDTLPRPGSSLITVGDWDLSAIHGLDSTGNYGLELSLSRLSVFGTVILDTLFIPTILAGDINKEVCPPTSPFDKEVCPPSPEFTKEQC